MTHWTPGNEIRFWQKICFQELNDISCSLFWSSLWSFFDARKFQNIPRCKVRLFKSQHSLFIWHVFVTFENIIFQGNNHDSSLLFLQMERRWPAVKMVHTKYWIYDLICLSTELKDHSMMILMHDTNCCLCSFRKMMIINLKLARKPLRISNEEIFSYFHAILKIYLEQKLCSE